MGMLNELRGETSDLSEDVNGVTVRVKKDVEPTKRTRRKSRVQELGWNTLEGFDTRSDEAEDRISELEDEVAGKPNENNEKKKKF